MLKLQIDNAKPRILTNDNMLLTPGGVVVAGLCGLVTRAGMDAIRAEISLAGAGEARAFCLHADRAVMALGDAYLESIKTDTLPPISGALVVRSEMLAAWHSYARRLAHLGIVRKVFTSRESALTWATEQAAMAADQARWERVRRQVR